MTDPRQNVIVALSALLFIVLPSCSFKIEHSQPPPVSQPVASSSGTGELFVYPRNGQTEAQLTADRRDCNSWAMSQTGFDPSKVSDPQSQPRFQRAVTACLEARGYTVS
jgi:hypothetical protein